MIKRDTTPLPSLLDATWDVGLPWWDLGLTVPQQPLWDHVGRYGQHTETGRAETGKAPGGLLTNLLWLLPCPELADLELSYAETSCSKG